MERTQVQGVMRKPVSNETRTQRHERKADGVSGTMSPKATSGAGVWLVRDESAQSSTCCAVIDITEVLSGAVMIGVVNMNHITGVDGDAGVGDG